MVIDDFNLKCITALEPEAQAPLLIDAQAPGVPAAPSKFFQSVPGRRGKELDGFRTVKQNQLSLGLCTEGPKSWGTHTVEQASSILAAKRFNHTEIVLR